MDNSPPRTPFSTASCCRPIRPVSTLPTSRWWTVLAFTRRSNSRTGDFSTSTGTCSGWARSARILNLEFPASLEEIGEWCRKRQARRPVSGCCASFPRQRRRPRAAMWSVHETAAEAGSALFDPGVWLVSGEGSRSGRWRNRPTAWHRPFKAQRSGAYEGLIVDRHGHVTEGSTCNLLAISDGVLLRPLEGNRVGRCHGKHHGRVGRGGPASPCSGRLCRWLAGKLGRVIHHQHQPPHHARAPDR